MSSQLPGQLSGSVSIDKLDLILDKLTAIERRLDILEHVNEVPGVVATALDVTDAYFDAHPPDTERLMPALNTLAQQLMQPQVLEGLNQLVQVMPVLAHYSQSLGELPGLVATAGDVFDELAQTLEAEGLSPLSLISDLLPLLRTLLQPESLSALHQFLLALPEMTPVVLSARQLPGIAATAMDTVDELYERLVQSDERVQVLLTQIQHLQSQVSPDDALKTAAGMMQTLQEGRKKAPALGPLGLLKSLSDPDLQRLLGYLVYVSRQMSKDILKN